MRVSTFLKLRAMSVAQGCQRLIAFIGLLGSCKTWSARAEVFSVPGQGLRPSKLIIVFSSFHHIDHPLIGRNQDRVRSTCLDIVISEPGIRVDHFDQSFNFLALEASLFAEEIDRYSNRTPMGVIIVIGLFWFSCGPHRLTAPAAV